MAFVLDLQMLDDILGFEPQEEVTGSAPSFVDHGEEATAVDPSIPISIESRVLNLEVKINSIYKLIARLADEMRTQRTSLQECAFRIKNPNSRNM